jgi:hypothetical protein
METGAVSYSCPIDGLLEMVVRDHRGRASIVALTPTPSGRISVAALSEPLMLRAWGYEPAEVPLNLPLG